MVTKVEKSDDEERYVVGDRLYESSERNKQEGENTSRKGYWTALGGGSVPMYVVRASKRFRGTKGPSNQGTIGKLRNLLLHSKLNISANTESCQSSEIPKTCGS